MQAYREGFARVYNARWGRFAQQVAPVLQEYYESTTIGKRDHRLLDVCCGTGFLAGYFLRSGYTVLGLDLSPAMLDLARQNLIEYQIAGQVEWLEADASHFSVDGTYGLAVSTFDALNHLPDLNALRGCFASVYAALEPQGIFIFDLNTRGGLERWNSVSLEDTPEMMLVNRGIYDTSAGRAYVRISGFVQAEDGRYDRFEETAYNTAFDLAEVKEALGAAGFSQVHFSALAHLDLPLADPEAEARVFVVARR